MDPIVIVALIGLVGTMAASIIAAFVKFTIESRKAREQSAKQHAKTAAALKTLKKESKFARKNLDAAREGQDRYGAITTDTLARVTANEERVAKERPIWLADRDAALADRKLMAEHIEADAAFQARLEPLIPILQKLADD